MGFVRRALASGIVLAFGAVPISAQAVTAITLHAARHAGAAATDLSGTAPPFTPIIVTLRAIISIDLPIVNVQEVDTQADARGQFSLTLSDGSVSFRPATFVISAMSLAPGVDPATVRIEASAPNPAIHSAVDETPPQYR